MRPTFCGTRCREKKGGWVQELFPTHPTYQNPIFINPRPLLCKVSWISGFSIVCNGCQQQLSTTGANGPMGPKGGPMEAQRRAQRKGTKGRGPYSLMDHQWIHWWCINEYQWWISINEFFHRCPSMNIDGFPVLWNLVLWKSHEKTMKNLGKQWKNNEKPPSGPLTDWSRG